MLGFILGAIFGGIAGIFTMALCIAAKNADEDYEQLNHENK